MNGCRRIYIPKFRQSVISVNGVDGINDVEGKAVRVMASSRGNVSEFQIRGYSSDDDLTI